jgi:hypothetical protein
MRIAYVSCRELPEPDIDERPLVDGLIAAGHDAVVAAWDDESVDWSSFDLALVRATWNYAQHIESFRSWIDRVSSITTLANDAQTLKWNLHKEYLRELEEHGVPIVPTEFFDQHEKLSVSQICDSRSWSKIVIKPTISAGSFGTKSFDLSKNETEYAQAFFDEMIAQRDMMIQQFVDSVDTVGETAIIVIDGQITHAIEKRPRFDDQDEEVYLRESISDEMREFTEMVLEAAGQSFLYARVDVMPDENGALMLSELEMLEPSLFFPYSSHAIDIFVKGVEKRMQQLSPE